jgi:F-type H+-transporting ATPase subunit b
MQIDWLIVSAQIINFLILVWLLKHFLYQPVLNFMDERERRIAARLDEAAQREQEAQRQAALFRRKTQDIEETRDRMIAEGRASAESERHRLIGEARHDIDQQRARWHEDLRREQAELRKTLKRVLAESATRIGRQALADLAEAGLERQVIAAFVRRLQTLPDSERRQLAETSTPLRLTAAFDVDRESRERLHQALADSLGTAIKLEIQRDPDLICGIILAAPGQKIEWNIAQYFSELEQRLDKLLGQPQTEAV